MDDSTFKNDLKGLLIKLNIDPDQLNVAVRGAMFMIAQLIDLPKLSKSTTLTGIAGTADYSLTNYDIDRITSLVYGTYPLSHNQVEIADYQAHYRSTTTPTQSTPYEFCLHESKLWLYYVPDTSSTIYITYQKPINGMNDIDDKYTHIMYGLGKLFIYPEGSREWWACSKQIDLNIEAITKQFKLKRTNIIPSLYRALRIRDLNEY